MTARRILTALALAALAVLFTNTAAALALSGEEPRP